MQDAGPMQFTDSSMLKSNYKCCHPPPLISLSLGNLTFMHFVGEPIVQWQTHVTRKGTSIWAKGFYVIEEPWFNKSVV